MIDPEPGEISFVKQAQQQGMSMVENLGLLYPQRDQVVDAEEPAVVDFLAGDLPVGEPEPLLGKQAFQPVEALRFTAASVKSLHRGIDGVPDRRILPVELLEVLLDEFYLGASFVVPCIAVQGLEDIEDAEQLDVVGMFFTEFLPHAGGAVSEDGHVGFYFQRESSECSS